MNKVLTLAELDADVVGIVSRYRDEYPMLHWGGMSSDTDIVRMGRPGFEERRAEMTGAFGIGQVLRAARFIDQAPRIKSLNMRRSTYGWKHVVERHCKTETGKDYYVGEGSFLIAAYALGLVVRQANGGGHYINLSELAAKQGAPA
jgi:hypothetical protein